MADESTDTSRRKPAPSDIVGTAIVGAVGGAALVIGLGYGFLQDDGQVAAGFLPVVVGGFILVAAIADILRMYFAKPTEHGALMSATEQAEEEAKKEAVQKEEADKEGESSKTTRGRNLAVAQVFGLLLIGLLLVPFIGLLLSLTAMVLAIVLWVERKPILPALLLAVCVLGLSYLLFVQLLGVPAPQGMLGII